MTDKEIIQALRVCSRRTDAQTCTECPLFDSEDCMGDMMVGAADLIERLTAENAALREKVPQWISVEDRLPEDHLKRYLKLGENAGHLWDFAQAAENMTVGRLKELAEADKDGRVVVLPCKVGDTVWFKTYKNNARDCIGVQPHEVTRISASIIVPGEIVDIGIPVDQIGVRVFLSETEAVAADAKPPAGNSILEV